MRSRHLLSPLVLLCAFTGCARLMEGSTRSSSDRPVALEAGSLDRSPASREPRPPDRSSEGAPDKKSAPDWLSAPDRTRDSCVPSCGGKCAGALDGCGGVCPTNGCPGCCLQGYCKAGTADTYCGKGGEACQDCKLTGKVCVNQLCTVPACGPTNCTGCCSSGTCTSGTTVFACGKGGLPCVACLASMVCMSGACVTASLQDAGIKDRGKELGACGGSNCPGCCSGNTCMPGTTPAACGVGGQTCKVCTGATSHCEAGTGICL